MTINNQPVAVPVFDSGPATNCWPTTPLKKSWAGRKDAVQLSRLGGVLNVFATDASSCSNRIRHLQKAVRDRTYSVNGAALGRKLISEMLVKR